MPSPATAAGALTGGGRFLVRREGATVVKRGDPAALRREARALRAVAGRDVAPALVSAARGVLVTGRLTGDPRVPLRMGLADARALGLLLRRVHDTAAPTSARLPGWASRAASATAYRARRILDASALAGPAHAVLAADVAAAAAGAPMPSGPRPFRLVHGDLVAANIVWTPRGPRLVDWEFSRAGDPAEDLAYLAVLNDLDAATVHGVLEGYGEPGMAGRLDGWRRIVALDAGGWYLRHGDAARGRALLRAASG